MGSDPVKQAHEYLNKNGFPFEMKVSRKFQNAGFGIHQSVYYSDPTTGSTRELDLIALWNEEKNERNFNIIFFVECKYANSPWILFSSITHGFPLCYGQNNNGRIWLDHLNKQENFKSFFECDRNIGYGMVVTEKHNQDGEGKNEKSKNNAYAAIQSILNFLKSEDGAQRFGGGNDYSIFVPIIAIRGKLIEAKLNLKDEIECREITEAQIHYKENIQGVIPKIHVITEEKLDKYIDRIKKDCERLFTAPYYLESKM